jgi:Ca-activated chloride channel family protein
VPDSGQPRTEDSFAPEIVVLLTDGANTSGIAPQEAAELAAAQGVRVYPIGFGTTNPTTLVCTADQLGGDRFDRFRAGGPGPGLGRRNFLIADEGTLREVAETTGGEYFAASDARGLQQVLIDLPRQVQVQQRDVEVSVGLVGFAVLSLLGAAWAAVRWTAFPT